MNRYTKSWVRKNGLLRALLMVAAAVGVTTLMGAVFGNPDAGSGLGLLAGLGCVGMGTTKIVTVSDKPEEFFSAFRQKVVEMQSCFDEMMEKVPEPFKATLAQFKTKADTLLATMKDRPTEQIPAAQEASWAIRNMASNLAYMGEIITGFQSFMRDFTSRHTTVATELQGIKEKTEKGELITKEQAEKNVQDALKAERERTALLATRRTELQGMNLPIPADELIAGEQKAFEELKKTAKNRLDKLTELDVVSTYQAAELSDLVFGNEVGFKTVVKLAEKAGGKPAGDPLGGGTGRQEQGDKPAQRRVAL